MTNTEKKILINLEQDILNQYKTDIKNIPIIFIIASPRTGSTLFYQLMIRLFNLSYFSNFTDSILKDTPIVGNFIEKNLLNLTMDNISLESHYGETKTFHEPSEATNVLKNWFEWSHPTEIKGKNIKDTMQSHFLDTVSSIYNMTNKPLITKNAWNGYRIQKLSEIFPNSYFIWLRRDIINSSHSDLIARRRKGDPQSTWSSATPANYKDIQKLHYAHQVVEAQYIYNTKVKQALQDYVPHNHFCEIWYEELENNKEKLFKNLLSDINNSLEIELNINHEELKKLNLECAKPKNHDDDYYIIKEYATNKYPDFIKKDTK